MKLAFVFPGQGSQAVGMLNALAESFPQVESTFSRASDVLGYDLWTLVANGPAEQLNRTTVTQPAMLAAGVAVWEVWKAQGGQDPMVMAGHSLGEYSALVCAGAIAFEAAIALVAERGRLMQEAVPGDEGAMAAILGLDDDQVRVVCAEAAQGAVVEAVNFNSPGQVVIAGERSAVERAMERAKAQGAKRALLLPVSVPSHCALMQPAAERLAVRLNEVAIAAPRIPVLHNYDVQARADAQEIRQALTKQLYNPVRWVETIRCMSEIGADAVIECGPGKVLIGLNKRIVKDMEAKAIYDPATLQAALGDKK